MRTKSGTFEEFKRYTIDVASGKRTVDPKEPKVWVERVDSQDKREVAFRSLEAGAKLLSAGNRELLRVIATRHDESYRRPVLVLLGCVRRHRLSLIPAPGFRHTERDT